MKRLVALLAVLICMAMILPLTAFAGDIPESLLYEEGAQIFFGEVLSYDADNENPKIEVWPQAVIKGNVKIGWEQIYSNPDPVGDFKVREGKVYLFTYYEGDNYIDIFEVTTYDTRTLKVRHVEGPMWERFEQYLNEGKYGEAKIDGMTPYTADIIRYSIRVAAPAIAVAWVISRRRKNRLAEK
ncbi:MAG: hypothetical protein IJE78_15250 [Bacteroidaceae bacterium]|nr:hypothetical protein [Bacteroidaceae bacterium]